ncbi:MULTISPECIES: IscS subfamily cysteine desulfurase [Leptospirillum]|jgi:cysteine desulfurase|uniref:Cysteine desulfurase IscS n=3 Tax=Leptospirillum ferriphilum TaxID=178606 RepID=A0A059XTC3_9BACT|nr:MULTISPECIES: IscS subfamily cysteine desulfurase [Leptospirillum]EAY57612.1 MAG: Cysteine desulfurase [Leptospirillum rubarum]EIJ76581.1 MAG: Cysteine desulfurase [Leptospirillum sp. Group II 'C75']AFS52721.1 cysteine desulfurase [Leptospirillum ferriphilum ML-04]AIA30083.1 cysteine desulfurase [Leptospirillum ferriphilum YSK]AKS22926.1 cysteine desulfurase [Leptospirillum sp. Group II 'CF-1']
MDRSIYLDNHATTKLDPRVLDAMIPYFTENFGNAASRNHAYGWKAEEAVDQARSDVAALIGADPKEIVFTSGMTESDNLAIKGVAEMYREKGNHLIAVETDIRSILDPLHALERHGFTLTILPVDSKGRVDPEKLREAIRPETILVSMMMVNHEIGTIQPMEEIGKITREKGVLLHVNASYSAGTVPIDVNRMNIDLLSMNAHLIYGPKGVGALYVRRKNPRVRITPQIEGGGHERGLRSGTLNTPGIVGMGVACRLLRENWDSEIAFLTGLRNKLENGIMEELDYVSVNGDVDHRSPAVSNLSFAFVEGEALLMGLKEIALSSGSACTSSTLEPSYVLRALGVGTDLAHSSIRFTVGRFNTEEEISYTVRRVKEAVSRLRDMSPLYEMAKEGIDLKSVQWNTH